VKVRKKLIEVALPLEAINLASAREKSIRHGHPSTLHLWWARRPLAAARAVIFSQLVDDPSAYTEELLAKVDVRRLAEKELQRRLKIWHERKTLYEEAGRDGQIVVPAPGPNPTLGETAEDLERERLFVIIRELVIWENTTNETILTAAREEIWKSWRRTCADNKDHPQASTLFNPEELPIFHDPFAGGGAIPLEAQRLGLEAHASDLNPVAVLINKAMIEIPKKFAARSPVNLESQRQKDQMGKIWEGADGLAEDLRYYGRWMRDEAKKRIGHLYPTVKITAEMIEERPDLQPYVNKDLTVIAWLWARTVKSPNPAFADVDVPLASTFMLSAKPDQEAYVEPLIEDKSYRFMVRMGKPKDAESAKNGTKLARGANFRCLMSGAPIPSDHIYGEANSGRMGARLMAIVAESDRGRVYLRPTSDMEKAAEEAEPTWKPELAMPHNPRWFSPPLYGLKAFGDLFTNRQLLALDVLSDLVSEVRLRVTQDAKVAGFVESEQSLANGGDGALAYGEAIGTYLAFAADKVAEGSTTLCTWSPLPSKLHVVSTFGRQALPMTWDYAESNIFANSSGNVIRMAELVASTIERQSSRGTLNGVSIQADAARLTLDTPRIVSTDPPYYDNIGYADLSDFFYVWLRRSLQTVFPELFATVAVPKAAELVATPYRHGSKEKAEEFFLSGMTEAMRRLAEKAHPVFPVTIYYAFKQSENEIDGGTANTGWETFLDAVLRAGFSVTGTWPVRTERSGGFRNKDQNALASSIVLVCRRRALDATTATRREFIGVLKAELPEALAHLQRSNIAPVDLAQAAIGPGMAVYTRYTHVLDATGKPLSVRDALALINHTLDEALADQEGDFDADTRWAVAWFEESGFDIGSYGVAETLSIAKNTSVVGMVDAGILSSKSGNVRLLRPDELPPDWDPVIDPRVTAWEVVHQLIRVLEAGGEKGAADLVARLGGKAEAARELAYRLYTICERKKRAPQALSYNALVQSWPEILRLARQGGGPLEQQQVDMFGQGQ
jgi:putative DNA methylase